MQSFAVDSARCLVAGSCKDNSATLRNPRHPLSTPSIRLHPTPTLSTPHRRYNLFGALFLLEMVFKLVVLGVKKYCASPLNLFDGATVVFWLVDIGLMAAGVDAGRFIGSLKVFRLLRIFKLASSLDAFRSLLAKMAIAIRSVYWMLMLLIIIFIFTLFAAQL